MTNIVTKYQPITGKVGFRVVTSGSDPSNLYKSMEITGALPACIDSASYFYWMPTDTDNTYWKLYINFDYESSSDPTIVLYDYFGSNQITVPVAELGGDNPVEFLGLTPDFIETYSSLFIKPFSSMDIVDSGLISSPFEINLDIPFMRNTDFILNPEWLASDQVILNKYNLRLASVNDSMNVKCCFPVDHMFRMSSFVTNDDNTTEQIEINWLIKQNDDILHEEKSLLPDTNFNNLLNGLLGINAQKVHLNVQSKIEEVKVQEQQVSCNFVCKHSSFNLYGGHYTSESFNFANQPAGITFCSAPELVNENGASYCGFLNREKECSFFLPIQNLKASTEVQLHSGPIKIELSEIMTKESSGHVSSDYYIVNSSADEVITHLSFPSDVDETDQLAFAKEVYDEVLSSYIEEKRNLELKQEHKDNSNTSYILSVIEGA